MDLEHERRLTDVEALAQHNKESIERLESSTEAISRLATSMEVMVTKQEQVATTVEKLDGKVTALEAKPGKRWDGLVEKIIWAIVGAIVTFILAKVGL